MLLNRRLLALTRGVRWHITACVLLGLAVIGARVAQALLLAHGLARMFTGAHISELSAIVAWLGVTILVRALLLWLSEQAGQWAAHATKLRVRERLYRHLLALGPGHLTQQRTGEVRAVLVEGVEALENYFGRYLPTLVQVLVGPVIVLAYLLTLDPLLTLIVFGAGVLAVATPLLWQHAFAKPQEAGAVRGEAPSAG